MKSEIILSKRLKCAADCITKGNVTADVGCDHAYASIYLVSHDIAPFVFASDINDGPLLRAEKNIRDYHFENRIFLRKDDGINDIKPDDKIQSVLICGMGGNLIINILDNDYIKNHKFEELILQPQSDIFKVRHFLHEYGYKIIFEKMIFEDGKYYNIIKAVRGKETYNEEYEYIFGSYLMHNSDPILREYLLDKKNKTGHILMSLKKNTAPTTNQKSGIILIENEYNMINRVLERFY